MCLRFLSTLFFSVLVYIYYVCGRLNFNKISLSPPKALSLLCIVRLMWCTIGFMFEFLFNINSNSSIGVCVCIKWILLWIRHGIHSLFFEMKTTVTRWMLCICVPFTASNATVISVIILTDMLHSIFANYCSLIARLSFLCSEMHFSKYRFS